jgi:hypothetical protein
MSEEIKKTEEEVLPVVKPPKEELQKQLKKTLKSIDKKLKTLGFNTIDDPYKTDGSFKYNELDSNTVNIITYADPIYLGKALAKMIRVKKEYEETMLSLEIKNYPICMWFAKPIDNLIHDLTNRVKIVTNQALINRLTESKKKLETFLSEDEKLFNTLTEIAELAKL